MIIPLIYIELSRPRDLIKGGLNLIIGMILIVKKNIFDNFYSLILIVITFLISLYLVEIFSIRWNQLTDQEKRKLKTVVELKKNVLILKEAISLASKDLLNSNYLFKVEKNNEDLSKKKWVRNGENDNMNSSSKKNLLTLKMQKKETIQSKKDKMIEERNN